MDCPSWTQDNAVKFAAESGSCSQDDVFATYASEAQRDESISTKKALNEDLVSASIDPTPTLFGKNWSINAPDATIKQIQVTLGGVVVR